MYASIVERVIRDGFQRLSSGDCEPIVGKFLPDTAFHFVGHHALGADLHDVAAIRRWFERLLRLFPGIQFEVRDVKVSGMPWNTLVVTQLGIRATLPDGQSYRNDALQVVRLRWGRIVEDIVYEDTSVLVRALEQIAGQGMTEAASEPIRDAA